MATFPSNDSNIFDAEEVNWKPVVFPIIAAVVLILVGFGIYYYQLNQREQAEEQARGVLADAKTPEDFNKVAEQFPKTTQATLALLKSGEASVEKKDYDAATKSYQQVAGNASADPVLRDSAELGLAYVYELRGNFDDALKAYHVVTERRTSSPYAALANMNVARIAEQRGDKEAERNALTDAASLGGDSPFVQEAEMKLRTMSAEAVAPTASVPVHAAAGTDAAVAVPTSTNAALPVTNPPAAAVPVKS